MSYPSSYDDLPDVTAGDLIDADHENRQAASINAIEATLGLDPQGTYSTVGAALAGKLDTSGGAMSGDLSLGTHKVTSLEAPSAQSDAVNVETVQKGTLNYAADTGSTNTYAVALSPAPSAYSAGMTVNFLAGNANSGASTLNVNSLGAKSIKKQGSRVLEAGDIQSGQLVSVSYDGTNFQLSSTSQVSPTYGGQSTITTVGTISSGIWQGTAVDIAHGGTGQASKAAAFDALSPSSAKGDLISHDGTNNVRVAGNATTTNKFLTGSGNGSTPNAPQWGAIGVADVPTLDHAKISDFDTQVRTSRLDQMATPGADVSFGTSYKITNLNDPASAQDAATRNYVDQAVSGRMPTGSIVPFAGVAVPAGWLLCNGDSTVSRSTQAALFAALVVDKGTVTMTIASPAVLTLNGHGLSTGHAVFLETSGALPAGLSADTTYWVTVINANTFKLASTYANAVAGTNINTSGSQSGTHHLYFAPYGVSSSTTFNLPDLRGRVPFGAGSGTPSTLGARYGSEAVALAATDIPVHTHPIGGSTGTQSANHNHTQQGSFSSGSESSNHSHTQQGNTGAESSTHTHASSNGANFITGTGAASSVSSGTGGVTWSQTGSTGTQSANHTHALSGSTSTQSANHTHSTTISGATTTESATHTHTLPTNTGNSSTPTTSPSVLQPSLTLNFIIKT